MNAIETIAKLTVKGRETMTAIGNLELSFFDEGVVEHSGIWGECLTGELGHKSSGVINRLRDLGLFYFAPSDDQPEYDAGGWWSLTALGAEVANILAGSTTQEPAEESAEVTMKVCGKWTRFYSNGVEVGRILNGNEGGVYANLKGLLA